MLNSCLKVEKLNLVCFNLIVLGFSSVCAIVFDEVSSLHVWITLSSLANKDPNNAKALLFRQIELNWINAPLDDENDYIGLYLDSQPDENILPVSVHRLNGQTNGQIITDYFLPRIDFYNETFNDPPTTFHDNELGDRRSSDREREGSNSLAAGENRSVYTVSGSARASHGSVSGGLVDQCIGYCLAYHSRNKILARNCLKTNPKWMQESFPSIGARSLPSLMLPGSHNSGTYPKHLDKSVLHMINKYQMNQDESVFNQLVYGIRHLDLRVGYSKVKHRSEKLWVYHDIFRTEVSVDEVFEQVKRFLDLTSHEIIVMDFHRFTVGFQNENLNLQRERHAKLIDLIFKQLGNYIVPAFLGQHAPVNEYVAMGKRLIVGYADKSLLLGSHSEHQPTIFAALNAKGGKTHQVRDIDAPKQDQDETMESMSYERSPDPPSSGMNSEQIDRRMGTRIFNKLKTLRVISHSFSKRSVVDESHAKQKVTGNGPSREESASVVTRANSMKLTEDNGAEVTGGRGGGGHDDDQSYSSLTGISRAALFFPPVRHLWPNKDTIDGLAQYMNETTCRKYFGELRSLMAELTPTVFGAISDKYDGNRKLAQLVNRPVTDWIRDRWLHCVNIVATDFFLGNDLIRLSIYANKMRASNRNVDLNSYGNCKSFRRVEHLLDKSKIPLQFAHQQPDQHLRYGASTRPLPRTNFNDIIWHTSSDGNQIPLKPLTPSFVSGGQSAAPKDKRDSFVENMSDGLTNLVSSFKRLLNL